MYAVQYTCPHIGFCVGNNVLGKYDDLSEKFVNLEKRRERCNVVKSMFNCGECGKEFDNRKDLKEHKNVHNPKTVPRLFIKCHLFEKKHLTGLETKRS